MRKFAVALTVAVLLGAVATLSPASAAQPRASGPQPVRVDGPYAWTYADQPSNAGPYTPAASTSYNSNSALATTVTRSSVGHYTVFFPGTRFGFGPGLSGGGTVFVSGNCKVHGWQPVDGGISVDVLCFVPVGILHQGEAADSAFWVSFTNRKAIAGAPVSFAWADQANAASTYSPNATYQFNYGHPVKITRTATGAYSVVFGSRGAAGIPKVTAYGDDNVMCNLKSWAAAGASTKIKVGCFDGTGAAADSRFIIQYANHNNLYGETNISDAAISTAAPGVNWSYRLGAGYLPSTDIEVTSSLAGIYSVRLKNQSPNTHVGWNITTIGPNGRYCSTNHPDATASGDIVFSVVCDQGTRLKATTFTMQFTAVT